MKDASIRKVEAVITTLLSEHDPQETSSIKMRGARYDHGLAWVHFDEGFGGLGLEPALNRLVESRLLESGAATREPPFMAMAAPTIATWASDEQKRRFLRPMFTGEEQWCQLFSEPTAGSDFAGLACRADLDGDEWKINGQKVWNSLAHLAKWGMLVARTNPDAPKHKGMTYFVVDMHASGVEVRPLRQITGDAEFNEVFLTDVCIPDTLRMGPVGEGWRVALTTLMNERVAIGSGETPGASELGGVAADAIRVWEALDASERTPARREHLMRLWMRAEVARLTNIRLAEEAARDPGPIGSISKLMMAELNQYGYDLCVTLQGAAGQVNFDYAFRRPDTIESMHGRYDLGRMFLRTRALSIEGGTSEIMRNILGEQVLGLPGEPRIDKNVPWSTVPRG